MSHSTFVINLESRPDRLAKFVNGISDISGLEVFKAIRNADHPNYGCTQSHKAILQLAKERGNEFCIIFEDDATLRVPFDRLLAAVRELEVTPSKVDPSKVDPSKVDPSKVGWEILLFSASEAFDTDDYITLKYGTELVGVEHEFCGTYAMAVSCRAYDKLINYEVKLTDNVDIDVYSVACAGRIWLTLPFMCYVLEGDQSDIRQVDTTDDLEHIKLGETRLVLKNSFMSTLMVL